MAVPQPKYYTADEFFSFYAESTEPIELINGEIISMSSPSQLHQDIVGGLYTEIRSYISKNKGKCRVYQAPFDVKLDDSNVLIPDISVICDISKLDGKRCNGSPDLIIEVTSSNYLTDYRDKLEIYKSFGVCEYWIVDPSKEKVLVYFFKNPNVFNMYDFSMDIPVNIYQDKPIPLILNINKLKDY